MNYKRIGVIFCAGGLLSSAAFANLVINPTWDTSITSNGNSAQIQATINQAIAFYNTNFSDAITVDITFKVANTGLGSSNTGFIFDTYSNFRTKLGADGSTADDTTALASLVGGAVNPVTAGANVAISRANAKALGYSVAAGVDGTITLNSSICNLVHGTNSNANFYDFYAVACHEIDEVLGTISLVGDPFGSGRTNGADLFRYNGAGVRTWDTSTTHRAFFSIDGGVTNIVEYNQLNRTGGDWGDWIVHTPGQVQDFAGSPGVTVDMGASEMRLLDVVGYNRVNPVPEPATVAVLGVGALALLRRRKRA